MPVLGAGSRRHGIKAMPANTLASAGRARITAARGPAREDVTIMRIITPPSGPSQPRLARIAGTTGAPVTAGK